jgi:hypothetical protein
MIYTPENTARQNKIATVYDAQGKKISCVAEYNDETEEVTMAVVSGYHQDGTPSFAVDSSGNLVFAKVHIPGSKIVLT